MCKRPMLLDPTSQPSHGRVAGPAHASPWENMREDRSFKWPTRPYLLLSLVGDEVDLDSEWSYWRSRRCRQATSPRIASMDLSLSFKFEHKVLIAEHVFGFPLASQLTSSSSPCSKRKLRASGTQRSASTLAQF